MDDTYSAVLRALGAEDERKFLLFVESDLLRFVSLLNEVFVNSQPRPGGLEHPVSGSSDCCADDKGTGVEPSLWWCCSCPTHRRASDGSSASHPTAEVPQDPNTQASQQAAVSASAHGNRSLSDLCLEFPMLSAYHRMLIHNTARRFGLHSSSYPIWAGDSGRKNVRVQAPECRLGEDSQKQRASQRDCGRSKIAVPGVQVPLLLYSDLILEAVERGPSGAFEAEPGCYCLLGSARFGVKPLPPAQVRLPTIRGVSPRRDHADNSGPKDLERSVVRQTSSQGLLKRKGRGTFGYQRQELDEVPKSSGMYADERADESGERDGWQHNVQSDRRSDAAEGDDSIQVFPAKHDYSLWTNEEVGLSKGKSESRDWGRKTRGREKDLAMSKLSQAKNTHRSFKKDGHSGPAGADITHIMAITIMGRSSPSDSDADQRHPRAEDVAGPRLCHDTSQVSWRGQCAVCSLCREFSQNLSGCRCVRSVGDMKNFVAVFHSPQAAQEAISGTSTDWLESPDDYVSFAMLHEAAPSVLQRCSWEIGDAGKRPKVSVDSGVASRIMCRLLK